MITVIKASSSGLFINNLKPVLGGNLVLIGDAVRGKPVGFPIDLFKVTFWTVSLITKNSVNDSVSYEGFVPTYKIYDGVDKAWGDTSEDCTAAAITLIDGGTPKQASQSQTSARSVSPFNKLTIKRKERLTDNMLFTRE